METSIAPLLTVSDAKAAADFYKLAFRATEVARHDAGGAEDRRRDGDRGRAVRHRGREPGRLQS
jgi:uncharacterized glyoxalase superfamily protein PhnB